MDGDRIDVTTENVTALRLAFAPKEAPFAPGTRPSVTSTGRRRAAASGGDGSLIGRARQARYRVGRGSLPAGALRKAHGLQGPIDDAFMEQLPDRAAERHAAVTGARSVGEGAG